MKAGYLREPGANAAVEFALVVPVLFTLILGIISMSTIYFSQAAMHMAAENAARYWAVSDSGWSITSSCVFAAPPGSSPTQPVGCTAATTDTADNYVTPSDRAKSFYFGAPGVTFTATTGLCTSSGGTVGGPGVIVAGSATYNFNAMFVNLPVNMATTACYPIVQ